MSLHIQLFPEFGDFCANGEKAAAFRFSRIDPFLNSEDTIVIDFANVRNINSSFANALIANLISQNSPDALKKLSFANCNPRVRGSIEVAIALGLQRFQERHERGETVSA